VFNRLVLPALADLAARLRAAPGLTAKADLDLVRGLAGAGDDAAVVDADGRLVVLGAEAIHHDLLTADPFAAGAAAVNTTVADVRAMGGRPLALVDTLVSPDREHAARVLDGLRWAADLLAVPVVGGHLTLGAPPALAAACTGIVRVPLHAAAARPGDVLLAAFCLEGRLRPGPVPIFTSLRDRAPERLRGDGDALVEVAERGLAHAARDVSMPGIAGSLLQLLELAGCGATLAVDRVPRPPGIDLETWLQAFPSFGFVLAAPPATAEEACAVFAARGLACAACGAFDATGVLRITAAGADATVWDLRAEPLTGLGPR
jgi:selenophosphate synthetase-related protein